MYLSHGWNPSEDFTYAKLDPIWYPRLLSFFNVSHILYHNDVADKFNFQTSPKIDHLVNVGALSMVFSSPMLDILELNQVYRKGPVFVPEEVVEVRGKYKNFPKVLLDPNFTSNRSYVLSEKEKGKMLKYTSALIYTIPREEEIVSKFNTWDEQWPWPDDKVIRDGVFQQVELVRERLAEQNSYDVYQKVNKKLIHATMRAAELRLLNLQGADARVDLFNTKVREIIQELDAIPVSERGRDFASTVIRAQDYLS